MYNQTLYHSKLSLDLDFEMSPAQKNVIIVKWKVLGSCSDSLRIRGALIRDLDKNLKTCRTERNSTFQPSLQHLISHVVTVEWLNGSYS